MKTFSEWLNEETLTRVPFKDLLIFRSSMFKTLQDIQSNRISQTPGPVDVFPVGYKYQLVDGYHRVFLNMLQGADSIIANVDPRLAVQYSVADGEDRFNFITRLKYKGLERLADESILNDIRMIISK